MHCSFETTVDGRESVQTEANKRSMFRWECRVRVGSLTLLLILVKWLSCVGIIAVSHVSVELIAKASSWSLLEDKVCAITFRVLAFRMAFTFITSLKIQERKREVYLNIVVGVLRSYRKETAAIAYQEDFSYISVHIHFILVPCLTS